jgi:putative transposase
LLGQGHAQILVSLGLVRLEAEQALPLFDGRIQVALFGKQHPQVEERLGMVGSSGQSPTVTGHRLGALPLLLVYVGLMPNHFHLAVWPEGDHDLSAWMHWLMTSHVCAYRKQYRGSGHIWQARFKAFPIQEDDHLLTVLRYIECNPLRAALVAQAQDWLWSSLQARLQPQLFPLLHPGPVPLPPEWVDHVNAILHDKDLKRVRHSVRRGTPFGQQPWVEVTARHLGLEDTLRPPGRPRKSAKSQENAESSGPSLFA